MKTINFAVVNVAQTHHSLSRIALVRSVFRAGIHTEHSFSTLSDDIVANLLSEASLQQIQKA